LMAPPPGFPMNSPGPRLPTSDTPNQSLAPPAFSVPCGRSSTLRYAVVLSAPSDCVRLRTAPLNPPVARAETRPGDVRRPGKTSEVSRAVKTVSEDRGCHDPLRPMPVLYKGKLGVKPSYTDWAPIVCPSRSARAPTARAGQRDVRTEHPPR